MKLQIVNPCFNNPCVNGGKCQLLDNSIGAYICNCPPFYNGKNCQICIKNHSFKNKNIKNKEILIRFKCMFTLSMSKWWHLYCNWNRFDIYL
jgi:hypothetical protein